MKFLFFLGGRLLFGMFFCFCMFVGGRFICLRCGICGFSECAFGPLRAVGGLMGCVQSQKLGARASPSEVYPDAKLQWHFTCGFDLKHSLWLPFVAGFAFLKGLMEKFILFVLLTEKKINLWSPHPPQAAVSFLFSTNHLTATNSITQPVNHQKRRQFLIFSFT